MEKVERDDYDVLLLQVKKELSKVVKRKERSVDVDIGMGFSIPLPETFHPAKEEEKRKIFWSIERPPLVFLEEKKQAGFQAGREENERTVYDYERFAGAGI